METQVDKKIYRREIKQDALQRARKKYDARADIMKVFFAILLVVLVAVALVGLGVWRKIEDIPFVLWALFGTDVVAIVATSLAVPIMAYFDRWNVAAERDIQKQQEIEDQRKTIIAFEEQVSNKKIKITDWGSKIPKNDKDIELRLTIYNDSRFLMEDFYARIEEVKYVKNNDQEQLETDFPKNKFHSVWTGDPPMVFREKPIPPHDYAEIAIAETITKLNMFKLATIEPNDFQFKKAGFYLVLC
jgi:hypothetical protein